jgi:type II secretory pathway component PulC
MIAQFNDWLRQGTWSPLLEVALVVVLATSLAYWTWVALAPRAVAGPEFAGQLDVPASGRIGRHNLFGVAQVGTAAPNAQPASRLRLAGVVVPLGSGTGKALFKLENGKPAFASVGDAIVPGVVLKEVHRDHVIVSRDGVHEQIAIDRHGANHAKEAGAQRRPSGPDARK